MVGRGDGDFFINRCLKVGVFPKFVDVKTKSTSPASTKALQVAKTIWLKLEMKKWLAKRDALSHYLALLWTRLVRELHPVEWSLFEFVRR